MSNDDRILALDYGLKRVGVAVSDPFRHFAIGLETISYPSPAILWKSLDTIRQCYPLERLILGLPRHMNGQEGEQARLTRAFAEAWAKRHPTIPVTFWDERLTSALAEQTLREMGQKASRQKEKIDQLSAVRLLQDYLDSQTYRTPENV